MLATASNPAHPLSDSLLAQFSDPTLSLLEIATRNRTSLESLALTIARAETSDQLNDIHSLSIARTRYLASLLLSKSLHALTLILDNATAELQADKLRATGVPPVSSSSPDPTPDVPHPTSPPRSPELRQRTLETSRRAATRILQLSAFNPPTLFSRRPAHTSAG